MIPEDERRHVPPREVDTPDPEEVRRTREAQAVRAQFAHMRTHCPTAWGWLDRHTAPEAAAPPILPPSLPMTSGEVMAFRMGQRSVFDCMDGNADVHEQGGDDDG